MTALAHIIREAGEGERQAFLGGGHHTWKLMAEDTGGAFFMFEDLMAGGKTTPLHKHPEADETVYVLEGEIIHQADGTETRVGAGGVVFTPRGMPHAFLVVSDTARLLAIQSPGLGEAFYLGASDPTTDATSERVDLTRLQASAQANPRAIEILGPPPVFESVAVG